MDVDLCLVSTLRPARKPLSRSVSFGPKFLPKTGVSGSVCSSQQLGEVPSFGHQIGSQEFPSATEAPLRQHQALLDAKHQQSRVVDGSHEGADKGRSQLGRTLLGPPERKRHRDQQVSLLDQQSIRNLQGHELASN